MSPQQKTGAQDTGARVGERILAALTQREVAELLDALFIVLPSDLRAQMLERLPPDTQRTVQQIIAPAEPAGGAEEVDAGPVSMAKLAESWAELWREWDAIIDEATEEEGEYITQEEHWEPPYFDEVALAEDLDKVAARMQPLLQAAYENRFQPDVGFGEALLEAEAAITAALPDWMELFEGLHAEKQLTTCFLTWEWLVAQEEGEDSFAFAQRIHEWEGDSGVGLDHSAVLDFFAGLPEADQRRILEGLTAHKEEPLWRQPLQNAYSPWHILYMEYLDRYAPERYLENLRTVIPQHWQSGLPIIEDLLARDEYTESLAVVEETLDSLLRSRHSAREWTPESGLLFATLSGSYYGVESDWANHKTLLRFYRQAAEGLGQTERVHALTVQLAAFDHFFDWAAMFKTFAESAVDAEIRDTLFRSWRDRIARQAKPSVYEYGYGRAETTETWWVPWLLDSIYDAQKGSPWFQQQVDRWLAQLSAKKGAHDANHGFLRLLTKDLATIGNRIPGAFPRFYQVVIQPQELATPDEASRQHYLAQYAADDLWDRVVSYWTGHLSDLVPRPENAHKSNYTEHAYWMAALQELNPDAYGTLLAKWRVDHRRRRNLWKAMEEMNLR